jgi:CubicO group peptidase (beta-lactamase class C family)
MVVLLVAKLALAQAVYFPGAVWERKGPAELGFDPAALEQAVEFAKTHETDFPKDFSTQEKIFGKRLGPLPKEHGSTNGLVIRHGYIVASFGDVERIDPTYSAAKSYLSAVLGVAIRDKKIGAVIDKVGDHVKDGGYDSPHNAKVTWEHHVRQTSEWEGTLWGKNHDFIGEAEYGQGQRKARELLEPGSFYEYNDVRINRFALSLLRVFKKPLPEVLKSEIMDPIGASSTWKWVPYDSSYAEVDGLRMPSVSGGTRWGGGLWINTLDQARFGLLFLRQGKWQDKQILPAGWITDSLVPGKNPDYGYLWWLNARGTQWPGTPKASFAAVGFGGNTVWIDPEHDLVVVWRWHGGNGGEFFRRVVEAIRK